MKNIQVIVRYSTPFVFACSLLGSLSAYSFNILRYDGPPKQHIELMIQGSWSEKNCHSIALSTLVHHLADIYSSYKNALDWFQKGNPLAAINELNANCIPHIPADNNFIYKAYKLLITCYKNIDKDGIAQEKLASLSAAVKKDKNAVQQILNNTAL